MKIYTKTGDGGETGLFGGRRVPKDDLRVEAYGAVDELNADLGLCRALLDPALPGAAELDGILLGAQSRLFSVGASLATPAEARARASLPPVEPAWATELEAHIDRLDGELPPLRTFVLPGGSRAAAALHVARATSRRAERRVVSLHRAEPVEPAVLGYLNRLADLLFVLARAANARAGVAEAPWDPAGRG